mgnify:CR=1 FL=1
MAINKDELFVSVVPEEDVELKGKGSVRVRALTRGELHRANAAAAGKNGNNNPNAARDMEMLAVHFGMIDPHLNIEEVKEWASIAAVGEFQKVVKAIMRLSEVGEDEEEVKEAQREAYADFR